VAFQGAATHICKQRQRRRAERMRVEQRVAADERRAGSWGGARFARASSLSRRSQLNAVFYALLRDEPSPTVPLMSLSAGARNGPTVGQASGSRWPTCLQHNGLANGDDLATHTGAEQCSVSFQGAESHMDTTAN
jgi:hypothetical protein